MIKRCVICGKEFKSTSPTQKCCSKICSKENKRRHDLENYYKKSGQLPQQEELPKIKPQQEELPVLNRNEECFNCGKHVDKYHRFCSDECILEFFTPSMLNNLAYFIMKEVKNKDCLSGVVARKIS
ncbi:MAG: hypothetical protein J5497_02365 [Selenomonadaceae bacterium]|nr:hypothetical protein [Selenomonadaceae bacterium]